MNKKVISIISFLVSIILMVVLVKDINTAEVSAIAARLNYTIIAYAVLTALVFRIILYPHMWQKVLSACGINIGLNDLIMLNASLIPLKFVLPLKITELARAGALFVFNKIDFRVGVSSMAFMKVSSVAGVLFLITLGSLWTGKFSYLLLMSLTVLSYGFIFSFYEFVKKCISGIFVSFSGSVDKFFLSFEKMNTLTKVQLCIYAVVLLLGEVLVSYLIFSALGSGISFSSVLWYLPVIMFVSSLPVSVQGIGLREALIVASLTLYASKELLLSAGLLLSIIFYVIPALAGALIIPFYSGKSSFAASAVGEANI